MVNLKDPAELQLEFDRVKKDFSGYHDDMNWYLDIYQNNVFYAPKDYQPLKKKIGVNFLQVFADKLWDYLAPFPKITVPSLPDDKEGSSMREKILLATWQHNEGEKLWSRGVLDSVLFSGICTFPEYDFDEKCVTIKRVDLRRAIWQKSDSNSDKISTFWFVEPMTKDAVKAKYKVTPTSAGMAIDELKDFSITPNDGMDYYAVITRIDDKTVTKWVGNKMLVTPYNHMVGTLPVRLDFPLEIPNWSKRGDFYLRRMTDLQAEFNELWRQRANIVRKLGNPTVWGRGIKQRQFQPVKDSMALDGGFVGLSETGELGILTVPETRMIDTAINDVFQRMKDLAGFPTATFGESVGANTSGDALGMYFQPTVKMVDKMNTALKTHMEAVNAIILRLYDTFMVTGEPKKLYGYVPTGKYVPTPDGMGMMYQNASSVEFTKDVIRGNYHNVVIMNPVAPKDEIAYKRLMFDAAREKMISRTRLYDELGFLSPEDELSMLETEQANPIMNPQGTQQIMAGAQTAQQMMQPPLQPQAPIGG